MPVTCDADVATSAPRRVSWNRRAGSARWLAGCDVGKDVQVTGRVLVRGTGTVAIGDGAILDAASFPIELHAWRTGRLVIGAGARIGPGTSIEATDLVEVGQGARLKSFAKVLDNSWHGTGWERDQMPNSARVRIGAGAQVGARAIVLPGSELGDHAILPDDAILTKSGSIILPCLADPRVRVANAAWDGNSGSRAQPFPLVDEQAVPAGWASMLAMTALARLERLGSTEKRRTLASEAERWGGLAAGAWVFRGTQRHHRARTTGHVVVRNEGTLAIGRGVVFSGGPLASRLVAGPRARLTVGPRAYINYGIHVRAEQEVSLGTECLVGSRTLIVDRLGDREGPVSIGDRVWLAHGVTVLPGVSIGEGSAVAAGTVVDSDVPAASLALGSPMRVLPLAAAKGSGSLHDG